MKSINNIPTSKIDRATKLVSTGLKVGVNYAKYYGERLVNSEQSAKDNLNKSNASDIYDGLKTLKGSALKVAQMLSMEKNILPNAYVEKFSLSQFSVPPLSPPLVVKVFKSYFKKLPNDVFDTFSTHSVNAASIGQVHKATKDDKTLAVKIQYPGVSNSISTDLALVKPIAMKMFNLKGEGADDYFKEVESKLIEETNYKLELEQSREVSEKCSFIPNLLFPKYYKELSSEKILTMDWMDGVHLSEYTVNNYSENDNNKLGQALWDFYMYQIHILKKVHADPHPGNFLVSKSNKLIAIDFGCMKSIPNEFYEPYFELAIKDNLNNTDFFESKLYQLEILKPADTEKEKKVFKTLFYEMLSLFTIPFNAERFDFSDEIFFKKIADLGQKYAQDSELRKMDASRGSKHFIYINRTFFGLYNLMHDLKAKDIIINNYKSFI